MVIFFGRLEAWKAKEPVSQLKVAQAFGLYWQTQRLNGTIVARGMMTTVTVALPDECLLQLKELTKSFGVPPEELVRVSIEELLTRPEDAFRQTVE